ncbi:MAG: FkbM family methyltransferase [Armatimonadetes bacterium]|nr:FkbM family methyltransferase [Akkermansiaceae bacterium]
MNPLITSLRKLARNNGYDIVKYKSTGELLALHQVDLVLDIGANDGGYACEIRAAGWAKRIVSIEPQPKTFSRLSSRFSTDPLWQGLNIGLGRSDDTLKMNVYEMDVLSSFLDKIEGNAVVDQIDVPVKRLDGIWDGILGTSKKPFVKIDTQGFEMEIIEGLGARVGDVIGWQLELSVEPLYKKQPAMEDVIGKMRAMGYSLWKILPGLRDPATHRAFEFDGIFFKNT